MIRDKRKDKEYFEHYIREAEASNERRFQKINEGKIPEQRINIVKRDLAWSFLKLVISKYSCGFPKRDLLVDYRSALILITTSWDGFWKLKNEKGEQLDQYILSAYVEMLWMLSIGYLLEISLDDFKKLVDIIDRDKVKDSLYEYIIRARIKNRPILYEESYREHFGVPHIFEKIRKAISESGKTEVELLLKEYVCVDWYRNHGEFGWHNSHLNHLNTYFGYWSFETAAIVKIMELDDRELRDCQYYPSDLVHSE